ncbi:hypothetical protein [Alloalcanivorax profundimaris]|uniref:hypothetical protein n=1 Tax=Alloalcanivorax profundimaris TaxID=2735259 RepID=UPI001891BA87|nr:hypothetical protein [Alloalcanivorax profundimaris]UWN50721.1 hypothetical protein ASALC70_02943 [Alcanivorax sp. ALC70]
MKRTLFLLIAIFISPQTNAFSFQEAGAIVARFVFSLSGIFNEDGSLNSGGITYRSAQIYKLVDPLLAEDIETPNIYISDNKAATIEPYLSESHVGFRSSLMESDLLTVRYIPSQRSALIYWDSKIISKVCTSYIDNAGIGGAFEPAYSLYRVENGEETLIDEQQEKVFAIVDDGELYPQSTQATKTHIFVDEVLLGYGQGNTGKSISYKLVYEKASPPCFEDKKRTEVVQLDENMDGFPDFQPEDKDYDKKYTGNNEEGLSKAKHLLFYYL